MGMPQIPDGVNRPTTEEVFIDLLESIALEEMAISHILNAEGEKLQAVLASFKNNKTDVCGLHKISANINQTIGDLIIKEWLLLKKFNSIKDLSSHLLKPTKNSCNCTSCNHNNSYMSD